MLENINFKIEGLSSSVQNQLSFNKMIETKLAQIAAAIPVTNDGKIPGQPKNSLEKVNAVTTRGGKSTHGPPNPNHKIGKAKGQQEEGPSSSMKIQKDQEQDEETTSSGCRRCLAVLFLPLHDIFVFLLMLKVLLHVALVRFLLYY